MQFTHTQDPTSRDLVIVNRLCPSSSNAHSQITGHIRSPIGPSVLGHFPDQATPLWPGQRGLNLNVRSPSKNPRHCARAGSIHHRSRQSIANRPSYSSMAEQYVTRIAACPALRERREIPNISIYLAAWNGERCGIGQKISKSVVFECHLIDGFRTFQSKEFGDIVPETA